MPIRALLGLAVAASALATPASAAPLCVGAPDTGGVCAEATPKASVVFHVEDVCVDTPPTGCTYVPYPVVDNVWVGEPDVAVYCYGALDRALSCPT